MTAAPPIVQVARLVDLATDQEIARTTRLIDLAVGNVASAPGTLRVGFMLKDKDMTPALINALGGPTFDGTIPRKSVILEVSVNGGDTWRTGMWVSKVSIDVSLSNAGIVLDGKDFATGFESAHLDRASYIGASLKDVLDAATGSIKVGGLFNSGALMAAGGSLPQERGLDKSVPARGSLLGRHRLAFTFKADPSIANTRVTSDFNADTILRSLESACQAAAGVYNPKDTAPLGSRGFYSIDVENRTVDVGLVGSSPVLAFRTLLPGEYESPDETAVAILDTESFAFDYSTDQTLNQVSLVGSSSTHGMPDGGHITDMLCVNTTHPPDSTNWFDSLLVLAISTGNEGGGVFYWPQNGVMYPMSALMDVNGLWYDAANAKLYAATKRGVLWQTVQYKQKTWARLGGATSLSLECDKVWMNGGILWATATKNAAGGNGVFRYPALAGEHDMTSAGWGGWSRLVDQDNVVDAAGDDTSAFYYVLADSPSTVWCKLSGDHASHSFTVPGNAHVVGLDYCPALGRIFVRTEAGSDGFYYINVGDLAITGDANGDQSLADSFGGITVNRVVSYPAAINGLVVRLLAATDRGIWWSADPKGLDWQPTTGQNGMSATDTLLVAAGMTHEVLTHPCTDVAGASSNGLYMSRTGGIYYDDEFSQPVDGGAVFHAIGVLSGGGVLFLDNNVGALGNVPAPANGGVVQSIVRVGDPIPKTNAILDDTGGSGTISPVPKSGPFALPDGIYRCRRLNNRNRYTYRTYNQNGEAPYNAIAMSELSEVTADDTRDPLVASQQVDLAAFRYLMEMKDPILYLNLDSQCRTATARLLTLRTGQMVTVDYNLVVVDDDGTPIQVFQFVQQPALVVQHDWQMQGPVSFTRTMAASKMTKPSQDEIASLQQIVAGIQAGVKGDRRFKGGRVR